ncbi:snRNA-activating protein complex subunit 3 [Ditylenchus destructor]|uniref:snRNA-activating protein complex subunit 3 n=1 Tax=Ditylenchus destructor TaxID=166010 RepID=A0AAD4R4V0_9BILA|nr:snRNA-activating protein complex subunit 3 [Ditylenchus destructor]
MSMDKVFKSDEKPYISSPVDLAAFLNEAWATENSLYEFFGTQGRDTRNGFLRFMEGKGCDSKFSGSAINNVEFLHKLREESSSTTVKNQLVLRGKYFKYRDQELRRGFTTPGIRPTKDIIMTVHLLTPMNKAPDLFEDTTFRKRCEVKLLVRGETPLVKLRDKIFCASDFWCNVEDTEVLDKDAYFSKRFPSNFIFIHDTFYVETGPRTSDISEPIREFMARKVDFGPHEVKNIADVRIIDLKLRLGQPYLYQHQGKCEHLLVFSDLRLVNASDEQKVDEYPIRVYDTVKQIMCCVCKETVAVFVVTESDRMAASPAHMCESCFKSFHYDGNNRIGNFKAYHYTDRAGFE